MNNFLSKKDDKYLVSCYKIEIYIPEFYFEDKKLALFYGDEIDSIGIFNFKYYMTEKSAGVLKTLALANHIMFIYSNKYKLKTKLDKHMEEDDYVVFELLKDDIFINNINFTRSLLTVENMMKLILSGKFPQNIPYNQLIKIVNDGYKINGIGIGTSQYILETFLTELLRYKKNHKIQFRRVIGTKGVKDTDYDFVSIKVLPSLYSVFGSLTAENVDDQHTNSIIMTMNNEKESISPMEKILDY